MRCENAPELRRCAERVISSEGGSMQLLFQALISSWCANWLAVVSLLLDQTDMRISTTSPAGPRRARYSFGPQR